MAKLQAWPGGLVEVPAVHQKVEGLIPGQGACLGHAFNSLLGCIQKATDVPLSHQCLFLSLSLSLSSFSLKLI